MLETSQAPKFDVKEWKELKSVMKTACMLKFTQNPNLQKLLLDTDDSKLVEANQHDHYRGIGLALNDNALMDDSKWKGKNKLSELLVKISDIIRYES